MSVYLIEHPHRFTTVALAARLVPSQRSLDASANIDISSRYGKQSGRLIQVSPPWLA